MHSKGVLPGLKSRKNFWMRKFSFIDTLEKIGIWKVSFEKNGVEKGFKFTMEGFIWIYVNNRIRILVSINNREFLA